MPGQKDIPCCCPLCPQPSAPTPVPARQGWSPLATATSALLMWPSATTASTTLWPADLSAPCPCHLGGPTNPITLLSPDLITLVSPKTPPPWYLHRPADLGVPADPVTLVSPQTPSPWCLCSPRCFGRACHPSVPTNPITLVSPEAVPVSLWILLHQCPADLGVPTDAISPAPRNPGLCRYPTPPICQPPNLGLHLRLPAGASHGISTPQLK